MKRFVLVALVALVLLGACSSGEDPTVAEPSPSQAQDAQAGGDCEDATKAEGQAGLEMQDFAFAPTCLEITTAQGLRVHNEGQATHNWSVEGAQGLDIDVVAGEKNNTEATGLDPGTYTFFCKYHRESNDMEGELRVKAE